MVVVGLVLCLIKVPYSDSVFFLFFPYPGHEFVLTFHFDDSEFLVYSDDENRCFQYRFGYKFDIRDIKSVQVWDDVDSVDEIIFRYKKNHWNLATKNQTMELWTKKINAYTINSCTIVPSNYEITWDATTRKSNNLVQYIYLNWFSLTIVIII